MQLQTPEGLTFPVRGYLRCAQFHRGPDPPECCLRGDWVRLDGRIADVDEPTRADSRRALAIPRARTAAPI